MQYILPSLLHWIAIYLLDCIICPLYNLAQKEMALGKARTKVTSEKKLCFGHQMG